MNYSFRLWVTKSKIIMLMLILIFSLMACVVRKGGKQNITVIGSDTMVILGQQWAEIYMKKNKGKTIQVTGGGSGTGIAALTQGSTDLANASRSMKAKEKKKIADKGYKLITYKTALDGLSIYVHKDNPVDEISFGQLKKIYTDKITNWKEINPKYDAKIVLYGRQSSSGTYGYIKKHVLDKEDYSKRTQELSGTAALINAVSLDKRGIGYGGKAYLKTVKALKVKRKMGDIAYKPSNENVSSRKYPLTRPLYIYTTDKILKNKPQIKKYIDWILSSEGQMIVKKVGYYPISE